MLQTLEFHKHTIWLVCTSFFFFFAYRHYSLFVRFPADVCKRPAARSSTRDSTLPSLKEIY